ncbi:MAG: hypothetical protein PUC50_08470 [Bacteroidales bacterium]|nr:hypothetical protein [Bacteroidales bacterium]
MKHYSALREGADEIITHKKNNPHSPMTPQEKPSSAIPGHELEGSFSKSNYKNYKIRFVVSGEWAPKVELAQNNELLFY